MKSNVVKSEAGQKTALLTRALDQSELVHEKVEQAALGLSAVNAVLKDEITDGVPIEKMESALARSEDVEVKVQEAAAGLVAVNDALAEEIDERHRLEHRLSKSDRALSESRAEGSKLTHTSLHDAVTGLPNLTLFNDRLRNALAQARRHSWRLAVMFMDLDEFKSINDTHGHDIGDGILKTVARRLQAMVRSGDTVSRRSGDEFLFLMLEAQDGSTATALATKIGEKIAETCDLDGLELAVRASIGIALYPDDGASPEELLKNADTAMYAAKLNKQGPVLYGSMARPQLVS